MSYDLVFEKHALSKLEDLGNTDSKLLRQVFMKILALRRNPRPNDSETLKHFKLQNLQGLRVTQGEYRIIFAIDDKKRKVIIAQILHRGKNYKDLIR